MPAKEAKRIIIPIPGKNRIISVLADALQKGGNLERLRDHIGGMQKSQADTKPTTPASKDKPQSS